MNFGRRTIQGAIRESDDSNHTTVALISPVTEDRYGTKFEVEGWLTDHMMKTGQVDLNHAWSMQEIGEMPVGKPLGFERTADGLVAQTEWVVDAPDPVGRWAQLTEYLVGERILSAWSHVFDPLRWTEKDGKTAERALGTYWYDMPGRTYTSQDLLGYGPVFYAGNGDAQTIRSAAGADETRRVRDAVHKFGSRGLQIPPGLVESLDSYIAISEAFAERVAKEPDVIPEGATGDMASSRVWSDTALALAACVEIDRLQRMIRGGASRPRGG